MNYYKFTNYALAHTDGNEFRVLYFIINTLRMKKANKCRIYNDMIADYLNMDARTVMRMTKKLEEKNLLKKHLVYENNKSKVDYSLNFDVLNDRTVTKSVSISDKTVTDNASISDKTVTDNASINDRTVTLNNMNNTKRNEYVYENNEKGLKQDLDPIIHNNINSYIHKNINTEEHNTEEHNTETHKNISTEYNTYIGTEHKMVKEPEVEDDFPF